MSIKYSKKHESKFLRYISKNVINVKVVFIIKWDRNQSKIAYFY